MTDFIKEYIEDNIQLIEEEDYSSLKFACPIQYIPELCYELYETLGVTDFGLNNIELKVKNMIDKVADKDFHLLSLNIFGQSGINNQTDASVLNVYYCFVYGGNCIYGKDRFKPNFKTDFNLTEVSGQVAKFLIDKHIKEMS